MYSASKIRLARDSPEVAPKVAPADAPDAPDAPTMIEEVVEIEGVLHRRVRGGEGKFVENYWGLRGGRKDSTCTLDMCAYTTTTAQQLR